MPTTRTVRAAEPGPAVIDFKSASIDLVVIVEAHRDRAELTIYTEETTGQATDLVNAADLAAAGKVIRVDLAEHNSGTTIITGNRGGGVYVNQNYGTVYGTVTGVTMVNGRIISGGADIRMSPIAVTARVPAHSAVRGSSQSGSLKTMGAILTAVEFTTQFGGTEIAAALNVKVESQSGSHEVEQLTGKGKLNTMSGNVDVTGPPNASATARTMSGNVTSRGGIRVQGSSMSGSVRQR